jgi:hypothetical protein
MQAISRRYELPPFSYSTWGFFPPVGATTHDHRAKPWVPLKSQEHIAGRGGLLRCEISAGLMTARGQTRSFGGVCLMSGFPPESGLKSHVVTLSEKCHKRP